MTAVGCLLDSWDKSSWNRFTAVWQQTVCTIVQLKTPLSAIYGIQLRQIIPYLLKCVLLNPNNFIRLFSHWRVFNEVFILLFFFVVFFNETWFLRWKMQGGKNLKVGQWLGSTYLRGFRSHWKKRENVYGRHDFAI